MTNIIIIFLQTSTTILTSNYFNFLNDIVFRCKLYLKSMNKIVHFDNPQLEIEYYENDFFDFENIRHLISEYKYIVYLDDKYNYSNINLFNLIEKSVDIFNENSDIHQIIFNDDVANSKNISNINIKNAGNMSNYELFNKITQSNKIFTNEYDKNPYNKVNYNCIKYENLINIKCNKNNLNEDVFENNFRLVSSIINTNFFLLDNIELFTYNSHIINSYVKKLEENNFKSNYITHYTNKYNVDTNNSSVKLNGITIVTAFLDLGIKRPAKRPTQEYEYIEKAKGTLSLKHNMVIYVSKNLIEYVEKYRKSIGLEKKTKIIEISIEDNLYMYEQLDKIKENVKKNISPYDIAEYVLSVNSRYEYIKDAIENNYFSNEFYAWVDFSAGHIVDIPEKFKITYSEIGKIRIAWISRINKNTQTFKFNHYCLGGGVFIGHKNVMLELIKIHDIEFKNLVKLGYCINDDKLLFIIFEKYSHLFDVYHCGYKSLLTRINA